MRNHANYIHKVIPTLLAVAFLSFTAFSQKTVPTPPPLPDDEVVKISTALIQLDVNVTDKKGNPIKDLKPEEVEIYENGKKQTITNFNFVSGENQTTVAESPKNEDQTNIPLPPTQVRSEQVRRTIALVVDDLTLSFESTYYVKRALKKFVDEQMRDGDLVAIIRTGAGIGALQQFTTDKRQLYAAIEKVRWNPMGNGGISAFAPIESNDLEAAGEIDDSEDDGNDSEDGLQTANDADSFRESLFATGTLGAINYIVRGMQELPGRKSVMLFSDGFSLFNTDGSSGRVLDALRRLTDLANRASVVVYTMDARGLQTLGLTAADNVSGKSAAQIESALSDRRNKNFSTQEGLIYLAKQTGGIAIRNNNDLTDGVRRMLNDQSYYLVGYEPEDGSFDPKMRKFNKIEVKVKRPGVSVRYRSGFFNVSDEQIAAKPAADLTDEQKLVGALTSPFAANDIALRLNAVFGNDEKAGSFIRSFLHIEGKNIKFTDEPDGKKKAVFDILAIEFGDNGIPVDQISKTFTALVDEKRMLDIQRRGIVYDFIFPVKKYGAYQLRVAIHDKGSSKIGSANQFVEVPNIKKNRLVLSGIILENIPFETYQQLSAGQNVPRNSDPFGDTALRQFKRGTVLNYGLSALNPKLDDGGKPNLTTQIRLFRDGKIYYTGTAQAFNLDSQTDPQKVQYGGSLSLGTEMPTGDYILQVVVTDNLAKKKRQIATQFVQFEVIE